jgi:hemerythrin-like domain-containing protein
VATAIRHLATRPDGPRIRATRGWCKGRIGRRLGIVGTWTEEPSMNATEVFEAIRAFGEHEHLDLARGLDRIHDAACAVGHDARVGDLHAIREVLRWASDTLEPHIEWEETWLYPQIDSLTGTPWATRAARFDHGQIHGIAARLERDVGLAREGLTPPLVDSLRADLFAYEAVIRTHIDREERLLLPVLEDAAATAGATAGDWMSR